MIDVRAIPRSCHNPQFNLDALADSLAVAAIDYLHMPGLGGLRHAHAASQNTGWHNARRSEVTPTTCSLQILPRTSTCCWPLRAPSAAH
ncbi:DUF488 domain-containing protein [Rhodoferax antarcticus]|uniref:DUF488 domain-containing protein n=1 Tax=Rhodoferax antarcticus TaxID=81479 RepID=UPI002379CE5B|nr:DUF488 domain-containing protein [Rhodoferax antarcticus]